MRKGVRLTYRQPQPKTFGVEQQQAALAGMLLGVFVVLVIVWHIDNAWMIATVAIIYGFIAQVPGAYLVRISRRIKAAIGG